MEKQETGGEESAKSVQKEAGALSKEMEKQETGGEGTAKSLPKEAGASSKEMEPTGGKDTSKSLQKEAVDFIREAMLMVDELKKANAGDATFEKICDALGFCVARCYSLAELQAHITQKFDLDAEHVRGLYEAIVSGTGDVAGGEAYAKYAEVSSAKRKKAEEAKQEAEKAKQEAEDAKEAEDANEARVRSCRLAEACTKYE